MRATSLLWLKHNLGICYGEGCNLEVTTLPLFLLMSYDEEILRVLYEAGQEGLPVSKIVLHVYNACNSLFCPIELETVRKYVVSYVRHNTCGSRSLLKKASRRGRYCLNPCSRETEWLQLFAEENRTEQSNGGQNDGSLSLF